MNNYLSAKYVVISVIGQHDNALAFFITAAAIGGAAPTVNAERANRYSRDHVSWENLPKDLSPVTGKIDNNTYALIFDQLELVNGVMDLWNYSAFLSREDPIRIFRGASTVCAIKNNMSNHPSRIQTHYRKILAMGKFCEPYSVWLSGK